MTKKSLIVMAGEHKVPMPPIVLPKCFGNETIQDLESIIQPQVHKWMLEAYKDHKILETIVKIQRINGYLMMSIDICIDTRISPCITHGLSFEEGSYLS